MLVREFAERVKANPELEAFGAIEVESVEDSEFLVRHRERGFVFAFSVKVIKELSWDLVESVLTLRRELKIMQYFSRITGYFSNLRSWNKSKLAELADRHKGNYGADGGKA